MSAGARVRLPGRGVAPPDVSASGGFRATEYVKCLRNVGCFLRPIVRGHQLALWGCFWQCDARYLGLSIAGTPD
eukprot:7367021-Alexandrium_andersonii.AAC.1